MSFSICIFIVMSISPVLSVISKSKTHFYYDEDIYIGVKQLSEYLIGSYFISLDDEYTYISRDGKEMTLYFDDDKLVKKPGYEVLMTNIDDVYFETKNSYLYMNVIRDEREYNFLISYMQEIDNEK